MQKTANKGFTLIEMLLVIVIIGILMGAVVVGINPMQRINDAKDAALKSQIGSLATAIEACYTKNQADWTACDTKTELETQGFIKAATQIDPLVGEPVVNGDNVCVCVSLYNDQTSGAGNFVGGTACGTGAAACGYYVYRSSQGKADVTVTNYCASVASCL